MARHADPDRSSYYRSVAGAVGKVLAALLVVGGIALVAINLTGNGGVDLAGGDDGADGVTDPIVVPTEEDALVDPGDVVVDPTGDPGTEDPAEEDPAEADPIEGEPGEEPTADGTTPPLFDPDATDAPEVPTDEAGDDPEAEEPAEESGINTNDVSVQVLDGGAGEARTQAVVATLEELGYQVLAVSTAREYEVTTVLYDEGYEGIAEDLRRRDERFAEVGPNPNLTEDVLIHVVVGTDWPE